jgi:hypothetical protein
MKIIHRMPALAAVLAMGLATQAAADSAHMRNGSVVRGNLLGATARTIHMQTRTGLRRLRVGEVSEIKLEPREAARAPASADRDGERRAVIVGNGKDQSIERVTATH